MSDLFTASVNCGLIDGNQLLNACGLQFSKVCVPVVVRHAACYPLIDITVNDIGDGGLNLGEPS